MKTSSPSFVSLWLVAILLAATLASSQTVSTVAPGVPPLVKFNGVLNDASGQALEGTNAVVFSIYSEQTGGTPLWQEMQNVQFSQGNYSVVLGSNNNEGVPATLFATGQPHWLGVRAVLPGEEEQPRILLASVPYALKAVDADTVGGLPASAFVHAAPSLQNSVAATGAPIMSVQSAGQGSRPPTSTNVTTLGGAANTIPYFNTPTDIESTLMNYSPASGEVDVKDLESVLYADQFCPTTGSNAGCALDIGAAINSAYANASCANGCRIILRAGAYPIVIPIQFASFSVPALLECEPGTQLTYGPSTTTTAAAVTLNWGWNNLSQPGNAAGVRGCSFTAVGWGKTLPAIELSGMQSGNFGGSVGAIVSENAIQNFAVGIDAAGQTATGANFLTTIRDNEIRQNGIGINIAQPAENIRIQNNCICNNSTGLVADNHASTGPGLDITVDFNSFDSNTTVAISANASLISGSNNHFENLNTPSNYISALNSQISLRGGWMTNDATGTSSNWMVTDICNKGFSYLSLESIYATGGSSTIANFAALGGACLTADLNVMLAGGFGSLYNWTGSTGAIARSGFSGVQSATGEVTIQHGAAWLAIMKQDTGSNFTITNGNPVNGAGLTLDPSGDLTIEGNITAGGVKHFKIDHPLDPANKYLYHTSVESPDMMNIYNGNVVLDEKGEADVQLPDWFDALNKDFRYQLSCIGAFAPVYIAQKIENNSFRIAGGTRGLEVSWQVTGIRHDAYAEAHRSPVEEDKPAAERGHYLHPELFTTSAK